MHLCEIAQLACQPNGSTDTCMLQQAIKVAVGQTLITSSLHSVVLFVQVLRLPFSCPSTSFLELVLEHGLEHGYLRISEQIPKPASLRSTWSSRPLSDSRAGA